MADVIGISGDDGILNILKVFYAKEGVQSLLTRNSPVLKKIKVMRVEGKTQNFASMYGFSGAVSGDYTVALANAALQAKNAEFKVEPGQLFSVYAINVKEIPASKSALGSYMRIAGNKHFAATEGMRKALAAALYGRGFGEIALLGNSVSFTAGTETSFTLPDDAIMKFAPLSKLAVKTSIESSTETTVLTVNRIAGNTVYVTPSTTYAANATDVVCLAGGVDAAGQALLPVGLGGWLPIVGKRTGTDWSNYNAARFFGVTRNVAEDNLCGQFVDGSAETDPLKVLKSLMKKVRRYGSKADLIVLNDNDWEKISEKIESTNSYFTQTSTKGAKMASVGFKQISAAFSTNFIENIVDDPYCPEGVFYILDSSTVELWSFTGTEWVDDGISENEPGKIMSVEDGKDGNDPYRLLIDDYISVQPGQPSVNGPTSVVSTILLGSFVVYNQSVNGVGLLPGATNVLEASN